VSTVGTRWYTLAEAAPILGVSVDTVRRRVKRGQVEARQVHTQHGPTWEVFLGSAPTDAQADAYAGADYPAQGHAEGAEDRSQVMATWAASLLAPIAAELGEARQTIERQAGVVADLRETLGRQGAELERAASTVVALNDQLEATERTRRRVTRLLAIAVAVLAALLVLMLAAPAWVR
jgi:hypothetical protein